MNFNVFFFATYHERKERETSERKHTQSIGCQVLGGGGRAATQGATAVNTKQAYEREGRARGGQLTLPPAILGMLPCANVWSTRVCDDVTHPSPPLTVFDPTAAALLAHIPPILIFMSSYSACKRLVTLGDIF